MARNAALYSVVTFFKNVLLEVQEEDEIIDLQVGKTVHTHVARSMRTELWLSVLHRKQIGVNAAKQYREMLRKPLPDVVSEDIEKDIGRTFPNLVRFQSEEGQYRLMRVLRAYAAYDEEVAYCQGMNFVAALLLIWLPTEAAAFGALVVLMFERGLRELYMQDLSKLQAIT